MLLIHCLQLGMHIACHAQHLQRRQSKPSACKRAANGCGVLRRGRKLVFA
jgi:hypothetical protein